MITASEATFARQVLRAPLPVLACFGTRTCPGRLALLPALERAATAHQGRLLVASVLVDRAPLLAEQYGVLASPTLMVFAHGDRQSQVIGFLPDGLVALLADEAASGAVTGDGFWSPVEERFEDTVMIPQLERWGYVVERQVACVVQGKGGQQRGRIDLLALDRPTGAPLTLVESKRQIRSEQELRLAAAQASGYALSLDLAAFVVAAPRGLWMYRREGRRYLQVRHFTSLELHHAPEQARLLLAGLCR
jgi:thioredoxin 1